jgi:Glucodextranase, domain B
VDATPIGDGVILQGLTDPGVSVSVNDLEIPVNTDGSFSKIILFGEPGGHSIVVRAFDNEGNEQVWRKQFRPSAY